MQNRTNKSRRFLVAFIVSVIGVLALCPALALADEPADLAPSAPKSLSVSAADDPIDITGKANVSVAGPNTYTGAALTPAVTVTCGDSVLVKDTDYTLVYANNTKAGKATVTVTGTGAYTGTASATFAIAKAPITSTQVTLAYKSATYTGKNLKPATTIKYNGATLKKNTDYKVAYSNCKNAGTAKITIAGKGNYDGTRVVTYTIKKASISKAKVAKVVKLITFDAKTHAQVPVVKFNGKKLVKGKDYALSYLNASKKTVKAAKVKAAGAYFIRLKGSGNFTGSKNIKFKINKAPISSATVSNIKDYTYNGKAHAPKPVVKFAGAKLKKGTAYTVTYLNSSKKVVAASSIINAGTYYVKIAGKGNFKGSVKQSFTIKPASVESASIQGVLDKIYNGAPQTQNPTVKLNGKLLTRDIDYTVSYWKNENVDAGTAWVTITGTGNYTDVAYGEFTIKPMPLSQVRIAYPREMKYTGSAVQPKPTLIARLNGSDVMLKQGVDYEVGYRDNVKVGTGTIVLSGLGNFGDTVLKTFTIKK